MSTSTSDPIASFLSTRSGVPLDLVMEMLLAAHESQCTNEPELRDLFTRAYRIPPTHGSWSHYRAMMLFGTASIDAAMTVAKVILKNKADVDGLTQLLQSQVTHSNICQLSRRYGFPFWLVGRDLCELLARTDSLADPNIDTEASLPFRAFHFVLPHGAVRLPDGDHLTMIGMADLTLEDVRAHGFDVPPGIDDRDRRFYVAGHTDAGTCYYSRLPVTAGVVADPSTQEFTLYDKEGRVSIDTAEREAGARCADVITGWALRLLIVMNAEPELIDPEVRTGERKARKDKRPMVFLDPRWLGRRVVRGAPVNSNGSHSSPHTHWRRGHMARRRCGKGRLESRVVYIRPVLVNGPKEEEVVA